MCDSWQAEKVAGSRVVDLLSGQFIGRAKKRDEQ